jgi:hypothetical protein
MAGLAVCIWARLNDLFYKSSKSEYMAYEEKFNSVRYIWTCPLPHEHAFEVSAIKEFLIASFNPPLNTNMKSE